MFCGCGGASLGFRLAGCEVVGASDVDGEACETYRRNLGLTPLRTDLRRATSAQLLEAFGLGRGDVDVVVGCPPCQPYSSLHNTRGNGSHDGLGTLGAFARLVDEIRPLAVVLENVPGLASRPLFSAYLRKMSRLGYVSRYSVLNAVDYGVPQNRRRLVCVSIRTVKASLDWSADAGRVPEVRTVRDAIGDLPPLRAGEAHPEVPNHRARSHCERVMRLIRAVPKDGGSRRDLPKDLWLRCHLELERDGGGAENVYGRIRWDEPAPTMTTRCTTPSSGRFLHPSPV